MSAESGGSRPPQANSAPADTDAETPKSESRCAKNLDELPDPTEKVREFLDEFGERAHVPLSETHGRALRAECVEEEREVSKYVTESGAEESVEEVVERRAVPLWRGVAEMLDWHEEYHCSTLRLEYGTERDPSHEILDIDLENSWFAAYQEQERAKLKALERETCGYETCEECGTRWCQEPDDHATEHVAGRFEEPAVVLTGRTASGAGRPPVDHARAIAEAWTDGEVRRSLRYILDEKLGLESDEWVRWTQGEPHPGDGENRGYHHAHDIIILDAAGASEEVTAATFRTMIEAHVADCEGAGPRAHDLDASMEEWESGEVETVSVKHVDGEIEESVASYAAAYLANESVDLLEREPEYLAWAATMWATETQKGIKSESANHAIEADRCEHEHATGEQDLAHGEEVTKKRCRCAEQAWGPGCRRCDGRGYHVVCMACGSPWEIEQTQTLAEARVGAESVAADGGRVDGTQTAEESREEELRSRWPSARSAASVGGSVAVKECDHEEPNQCPLCAESERDVANMTPVPESASAPESPECVVAGFERPPQWRAKAIIRDGEELPASGGGTDTRPLKLGGAPEVVARMALRGPGVIKCFGCGMTYDTVAEYVSHGCEGGVVGVGWMVQREGAPEVSCPECDHKWRANPSADTAVCPRCSSEGSPESPPEVTVPRSVGREPPAEESRLSRERFLAALPDRVLPGEGEESDGGDDLGGGGEEELGEQVVRYVEEHPEESAVAIAGRFGLSPAAAEEIESVRA
ncbi:hypothetical protein [Halosimplex pelagicum]|uniref:Uncharacterized protein n=1 Tax=Halosimplex pelagicum TaxID=869886 RepID=A0A7D5T4P6_9EURY|nr:hypothetical protein [Halosimplex pelagicum]QLH82791.1 hypothetical protein HZS54_14690 [Halosimplex pelagicum]